jgi:hypothetical protein
MLTEPEIDALEALAHRAGPGPGGDPGALQALTDMAAGLIGGTYRRAELAVSDWRIARTPIGEAVWWWRLRPGTRVHRFDDTGRAGTVDAGPTGEEDDLAQRLLHPVLLARWVRWDDAPAGADPELVFASALDAIDPVPAVEEFTPGPAPMVSPPDGT